jgi:hypothetical protein
MNWIWKRAIERLNASDGPKLNIVDIGSHKAMFLDETRPIVRKPSYWIAIDPCDYGVCQGKYNEFHNLALSDVGVETTMQFNEYEEPGCNSLLTMNVDKITHDASEYDKKWYVARSIENRTAVRNVRVNSFYNVFKDHPILTKEPIHFIKIDTQGNDIKVIRGMGDFLTKTYFIQTESVTSQNKDVVMYDGQQLMEDDVRDMEALGFGVFDYINYGANKNACPEADVVFYNKSLISL